MTEIRSIKSCQQHGCLILGFEKHSLQSPCKHYVHIRAIKITHYQIDFGMVIGNKNDVCKTRFDLREFRTRSLVEQTLDQQCRIKIYSF